MKTTLMTVIEKGADGREYLTWAQQVIVCGRHVGTLIYLRDGWYGVRIEGEGPRIDEWRPSQIELVGVL